MTRASSTELKLIDGATEYVFTIGVKEGSQSRHVEIATRPWETGDPRSPWRISLLPGDGGLGNNRLRGSSGSARRTYSSGPADPTFSDILVPGPAINNLTFTSQDVPAVVVRELNGERFIIGGRYAFKVSAAMVVSVDKDFGVGKAAVGAAVFNNELVVAMGPTENIYTRTTGGTWTQSAGSVFAEALGTVGNLLWRAEKGSGSVAYLLSNCTTAPLTLGSWAPTTDANKYKAGDATYPVNNIIDYGGKIHVGKADGVWAAGLNLAFVNITPQLKNFPHVDNTKGMFTAWGYLFVPSAMGLIRVKQGTAVIRGPELANRPSYKTWARAGVQVNEDVYLLVTDEGASANTAIYRMSRDTIGTAPDGHEYIYHHIADIGSAKGYAISASADTSGGLGQPSILATGAATAGYWFRLGWGSGRYVDDSLYQFSSTMSYTTGEILPQNDLTVHSVLVGVEALLKLNSTNAYSINMDYKIDGESTWYPLLSTQEGGGAQVIGYNTFSGYSAILRYAQREHQQGQFFNFRVTGSGSTVAGTNRPEIRELWAYGFARPRMMDAFQIGIIADGKTRTSSGQSAMLGTSEVSRILRGFMNSQKVLEMRLPDYEVKQTVRVMVTGVQETELNATVGTGSRVSTSRLIKVDLVRVDFQDRFALP